MILGVSSCLLGNMCRYDGHGAKDEFVLKLIFSEGAKVLSDGQSAVPKNLLQNGFEFKYRNIEECLKEICNK